MTGTQNAKVQFAQYFTPQSVADFMAGMLSPSSSMMNCRILDPGAGEGSLGIALTKLLLKNGEKPSSIFIEIEDEAFHKLSDNVCEAEISESSVLIHNDFISAGAKLLKQGARFSHIIMNPPYFKLRRGDSASMRLAKNGVDVTNIYAGFVWLAARMLDDNGQLVAIVPRSFCNGPYFYKFREFLVEHFSLDAMHVFGSRDSVFSKDKVLQENIIFRISKRQQQKQVGISSSTDQTFSDVIEVTYSFNDVVSDKESGYIISIPSHQKTQPLTRSFFSSLDDLGIKVSTGPVVDFRSEEAISATPKMRSVPLLYPAHMDAGSIIWPIENLSKRGQYYLLPPNLLDSAGLSPMCVDKNVSPADGYYVVTRRFSSKEEKRRIYAAVVNPDEMGVQGVAFENHLNYFHHNKHGLDRDLAYGLTAYLNSALLDSYFRTFSGHTQVNATDLRNIPYPTPSQLRGLGKQVLAEKERVDMVADEEILRVNA